MTTTREAWLLAMTDKLRPLFSEHGGTIPDKVRVSCAWPSRSAMSARRRRIGEAWSSAASADGAHETFLSPILSDAVEVGAVLVHELVHHAVGVEHGHKAPFAKLAKAVGLVGKMTATEAGEGLRQRLNALAEELGPYPHAKLDSALSGKKKQGTRMLKVACIECGCVVRMAQKWIDDAGVPTCACGGAMAETDSKDE